MVSTIIEANVAGVNLSVRYSRQLMKCQVSLREVPSLTKSAYRQMLDIIQDDQLVGMFQGSRCNGVLLAVRTEQLC